MTTTNALNAEAMRLAEQPAMTDEPIAWVHDGPPIYEGATVMPYPDIWHDFPLFAAPQQPAGMMTVEAHQRIVAEAVAQAYERAADECDAERIKHPKTEAENAHNYGCWICAKAIRALKEAS